MLRVQFDHWGARPVLVPGPFQGPGSIDRTVDPEARELREKLEHLQLKHPPMGERQPVTALDGMGRLAQEDRILIKEKVNMMQDRKG